ncbi:MAG: HAD family hydrolase [Anaerolineae bacterium]|nr:HAD family hydrolase [Anaerolineae bacterium]
MVDRLHAVLFDLDDTLLFSDVGDEMESGFLKHYFALLTDYARPLADPQTFMKALLAATEAMVRDQDLQISNEQAFVRVFAPTLGRPWDELHPFFTYFYEEQFPKLQVHTHSHPDARRAVQTCLDAGYRVVVATNPLFPRRAIEHRLAWAGVGDMPFALITAYENMHTSKPAPAYYREIAVILDVDPSRCVMVGNDVQRDIEPAQRAGMRTFLADQWLTGDDTAIRPDGRGKLGNFINWITLD